MWSVVLLSNNEDPAKSPCSGSPARTSGTHSVWGGECQQQRTGLQTKQHSQVQWQRVHDKQNGNLLVSLSICTSFIVVLLYRKFPSLRRGWKNLLLIELWTKHCSNVQLHSGPLWSPLTARFFFFFLKKLRMIVVTNPLRMTYKPSASHWCRTSHFACSTSQTTLSENNDNTVLFYIPIWLTLFYLTYFYQHLFFLSQQLSYLTGRWLLSQHCCFFFFFWSERSVSVSVLGSNPLSCFYEHHWNWIRTQDFLNPELVGYL